MMFRSISTLLVLSKLLEKLTYNRLISFVVKNSILTNAQGGFRENKSMDTASKTFIESIQEAVDKGIHAN
jgi:hypothetical protein